MSHSSTGRRLTSHCLVYDGGSQTDNRRAFQNKIPELTISRRPFVLIISAVEVRGLVDGAVDNVKPLGSSVLLLWGVSLCLGIIGCEKEEGGSVSGVPARGQSHLHVTVRVHWTETTSEEKTGDSAETQGGAGLLGAAVSCAVSPAHLGHPGSASAVTVGPQTQC